MSDYTENFTAAEEAQANKMLMGLSGVLTVVFGIMGALGVESSLTHYLWYAFAVASAASTVVFFLAGQDNGSK